MMDPEKTTPGILRPDAERQEQLEGEDISADADKHKQDVAAGSVTNVDDFASDIVVDPIIEKRILRRLDASLAPLFCVLYFLSYLDRSNIGNAAVAGLSDQLELSGPQLSTSISVFYATYVSLIVPIVLAVRWLKTNRAVSVMLLSWSLVTIGTAFVRHYHSLIVCRLILGICEAGLFPCISLYITSIYNPREQGLRNAYLFGAASLSGMFGGLVATGITKISSAGTLRGWSWLYIIEGLVSICVVPWAYFGLPEFPAKSKRWTAEELETLQRRELKRQEYMGNYEFDWAQVWSTFKDWRLYTGYARLDVLLRVAKKRGADLQAIVVPSSFSRTLFSTVSPASCLPSSKAVWDTIHCKLSTSASQSTFSAALPCSLPRWRATDGDSEAPSSLSATPLPSPGTSFSSR